MSYVFRKVLSRMFFKKQIYSQGSAQSSLIYTENN